MQAQEFFVGLADGATRVHPNKSEALPPRHYTTMQSTWKLLSMAMFTSKLKKNVRF